MSDEGFLNKMVDKCEVKTYQDMYLRIVSKGNNIIKCGDVFPNNPKYTVEKIKNDIISVSGVIYLELFELNQSSSQSSILDFKQKKNYNLFAKIPYLSTVDGFRRIIRIYRDKGFIQKKTNIENLYKIWCIQEDEKKKLIHFLEELIEKRDIDAEIRKEGEYYLYFPSLFEHPEKKKKIIQLFGVVVIFIVLLTYLLIFVGKI